ncbi:ABC-type phosphate transport system substrate-binding protein [Bradyrhizobium diazoefficiens]
MSGNIGQTKNSIGYVEYAYAKQNKLTYTGLVNKAGKPVQPTVEAFQAAASNADWAKAPGYYVILTDQPGEKSWPITAATFILMHKDATDKAASQEAIKFFRWAFKNGGKAAEELDYIPMPEGVVTLIEKTWAAEIKS